MSHEPTRKLNLEPNMILANGGSCPRCQGHKKDGSQCSNPARKGFNVCPRHGAGLPSREKAGTADPVGRPVTTGKDSDRSKMRLLEIKAELQALGVSLESSDDALWNVHAVVEWLLQRGDTFSTKVDKLENLAGLLEQGCDLFVQLAGQLPNEMGFPDAELMGEAKRCAKMIPQAQSLVRDLYGWSDRLVEAGKATAAILKARAETKVKLAEARAVDSFGGMMNAMRSIIWDIIDDPAKLDLFEERIQREIYAPIRAKAVFAPLPAKSNARAEA